MELDDAFTKAALYETCVKSKVLRNIDLDNVDTQTLRRLVNKYNALALREFPIIVTKVLVKFGLTFVTERMPRVSAYINPNNISVSIEADELAYLERTQSTYQPNLYMIVAKNIAVGMLGTSIQSLRELITKTVDPNKSDDSITQTNARSEDSDTQYASRYKVSKIQVNSVQQTVPNITTPKHYTDFADTFKSARHDNSDAPITPSVKDLTEQAVTAESVREKRRIETATNRQIQRDAVRSIHRSEIHPGSTTDEDDDTDLGEEVREEDAFDSVSVASDRNVQHTDIDAADIVDRFIKQQQTLLPSPPPTPHTHQQQSPPSVVTDNEALTRPLRSINANEFMEIIKTNYTDLLNDGGSMKEDENRPDDNHKQQDYYDDDDEMLQQDSPTPKPPPSVASSVHLTFDDDDDDEEDDM